MFALSFCYCLEILKSQRNKRSGFFLLFSQDYKRALFGESRAEVILLAGAKAGFFSLRRFGEDRAKAILLVSARAEACFHLAALAKAGQRLFCWEALKSRFLFFKRKKLREPYIELK